MDLRKITNLVYFLLWGGFHQNIRIGLNSKFEFFVKTSDEQIAVGPETL